MRHNINHYVQGATIIFFKENVMKKLDIAIVGNGVVGCSLAFALLQLESNLKIGIIGPSNREGAATVSSGAMLGCFGEVTHTTFKSSYSEAKYKISLNASRLWPSWIETINDAGGKLGITPGTIVLLNNKSGKLDTENFLEIINALKREKEPFQEISVLDIPGLNPVDTCRPLRAIFIPNEGSIDSTVLLESFLDIFSRNKNVTLIDDVVSEVELSNDQEIKLLKTKNDTIVANKYIFAAGAATQTLISKIPHLERKIPKILSGVGCSMLLNSSVPLKVEQVIRTPNRAGACGLHVLPRGNKLFLGSSNNLAYSPEVTPQVGITRFLLECFLEQIDKSLFSAQIHNVFVGNRPVTIDTFPVIGKTSVENLWILSGTYRDGVHQSPLLSMAVAKEMQSGETNALLELFKPERFPLQIATQKEMIDETVLHYMSGGYEHSMELPKIGWDDIFEEMIRKRIEEVYKQLETELAIPTELILMFDFAKDRENWIRCFKEYYKSLV